METNLLDDVVLKAEVTEEEELDHLAKCLYISASHPIHQNLYDA